MTRSNPLVANCFASSRPIPVDDPVTSASGREDEVLMVERFPVQPPPIAVRVSVRTRRRDSGCRQCIRALHGDGLLAGRSAALLAALAPGGRLLGLASTLLAVGVALARAGGLAAAAGGPFGVGDARRPLLAHSLLLEAFVLLVVLDARTVILRHRGRPSRTLLIGLYYPLSRDRPVAAPMPVRRALRLALRRRGGTPARSGAWRHRRCRAPQANRRCRPRRQAAPG